MRYERIALIDLLDRLLAGGVVISGEVRLSIADVDLVNVSLRALISSVSSAMEHSTMEHGAMEHGAMEHGAMEHGAMEHGAAVRRDDS